MNFTVWLILYGVIILYADAHCDTLTRIYDKNEELYKNCGQLDLERLINVGCTLQMMAVWIEPQYDNIGFKRLNNVIGYFYNQYENNKDKIKLITKADDFKSDKLKVLLTIEGGSAINGSVLNLERAYMSGVRLMTLTWNGKNELGYGAGVEDKGLTDFGKEVVRKMNKMGMIIDVSHLSDNGFYDIATLSKTPFFATHSNCRSICNNKRNLTDEQIKYIIKTDGFIGLNFYPDFLSHKEATITDVIKHAEHILSLGGEDVLGFGADFDGVDRLPLGISGVENMTGIADAFCKMGYSQNLINKVFFGNLTKKVQQILKN